MSKRKSKKLLIVIDPQEFFFAENKPKGRAYGRKLRKFLNRCRSDYVFARFKNSKSSPIYKIAKFKELTTDRETLLLRELADLEGDHRIFTRNVYTVFAAKGFEPFLKRHGYKKLILCGIATESCVLATARDAFQRGFEVEVLSKYCMSDIDANLHKSALKIIEKDIGKVR